MATLNIFKLKNTNSTKKGMKLNKKIEIYNFQNNKSKIDFFILFNTITKTIIFNKDIKKINVKTKTVHWQRSRIFK